MTKIEWTRGDDGTPGSTWNPTTGCDRISLGCDNCYALTMAKRLKGMGSAKYQNDGDPRTSGPGFGLTVHEDVLTEPLRWRKPRRVFVNSMSDLFHARVPAGFITRVWETMQATPQHTYQILTKRPERLARVLGEVHQSLGITEPLANVWLGTSVENQKYADLRIPALLRAPAAIRFLSCEPLLGPVDLKQAVRTMGSERGHGLTASFVHAGGCCQRFHGIDWVIVGGESGPGARPMHPDWARWLRDQCQDADVPFFFKQHGDWAPLHSPLDYATNDDRVQVMHPDGRLCGRPWRGWKVQRGHEQSEVIRRYGKKAAGRELDGRTWDEFPATAGLQPA